MHTSAPSNRIESESFLALFGKITVRSSPHFVPQRISQPPTVNNVPFCTFLLYSIYYVAREPRSIVNSYTTVRIDKRIRFIMNKSTSRTNANAPAPILETGRAISDQIMSGNLNYDNVAKKTAHVKVSD